MSGICGIVFRDQNQTLDVKQLWPMLQSLDVSSRGEGVAKTFGSTWLAAQKFRGRMSGVTMLARQGQKSGLAFHGTLFNLDNVISYGARDSDVLENLLSAYLHEGLKFVQRLRGEFALAIWNGADETLSLITDRFRVHPIFYYEDGDKLVFGSRMKAMLACGYRLELTINPEAIVNVVGASFIPTPHTIYREVHKLPPGCFLRYRKGVTDVVQYWDINFNESDDRNETELAHALKSVFAEAVSARLNQEVDANHVGSFLSGGVDSSTVTGVLTQLTKPGVKCFSIGFEEPQFNEISYARIAARAFSAEHHEYFVTPEDVCNIIPVLVDSFDEPFANASAVPTYYCAKLAREHGVDVLYAGDGGDELFAGNERYATQRLFDYYHVIPGGLRKYVVQPFVFTLAGAVESSLFVKAQKYIRRANVPYPDRLSSYGFFNLFSMMDCFDDGFFSAIGNNCDPYAAIRRYYFQAPAQTELDRQLYIDLKLTISDNDLFKVTRMTEAAGVTVRYPFLDHRVAEFAFKLPARMKMRGRQLRAFFKRAYADLLPQEVRAKQKHGFGLPIPVWLRTDRRLNEMMQDLVLSPRSIQRGYFRRQAVRDLVELHKTDDSSFYGTILWNLMILELWHRGHAGADVRSARLAS